MSPDLSWPFAPANTFVDQLDGLYVPWTAAAAPTPALLALNEPLAEELGLDPAELRTDEGVAVLVGNAVADGTTPVAQAYAGHQFGGYSPRANGVRPEPFRCRSRRCPLRSITSPSSSARPSPNRGE